MLILILVLVALLGVGGWFILAGRPNNEPDTAPHSTSETQQTTNEDTSAPTQGSTPSTTDNQVATDEVEIEDMAFQPASITVKKGTTVTWTNRDDVRHDVVPDQESDAFAGSQLLARDESYSFTFDTPGTYTYHCSPHPQMTGTVVVTD